MQTNTIYTNGSHVKTSVTERKRNRKILIALVSTILLVVAISVVYIIIYPTL